MAEAADVRAASTPDPDRTAVLAPIDIARAAVLNRVGTSAKVLEAILKRLDKAEDDNWDLRGVIENVRETCTEGAWMAGNGAYVIETERLLALLALLPPTEDGCE